MRTKNFIFLLFVVVLLSLLLIILGPSNNENLANIQNLANKHFSQFKVSQKEKIFFLLLHIKNNEACTTEREKLISPKINLF
jgi:hypothetical protein